MDKEVLLNKVTRQQLTALAAHSPQSLLLKGEKGVGLRTVANWYAAMVLNEQNSHVIETLPNESGTITIARVRELYGATKGKSEHPTVHLIDDVDAMGHDAQNAFLKLLEEPKKGTIFVLTSHEPDSLLPTIRSRVTEVEIRPIENDKSIKLLESEGVKDKALINQILFIAEGLPAELCRLARDETYRKETFKLAAQAKQLINASRYQQAAMFANLAQSRTQAEGTLELALRILRYQLGRNDPSADASLLRKVDKYLTALEKLSENGHVRTQLLRTLV